MKKVRPLLPVVAFSLLLTSCYDSTVPLSDPHKSKSDDRLIGVWQLRGEVGRTNYFHIGRVAENLPASVMRVVSIGHMPDGKLQQGELLVFPTTVGDKTYLKDRRPI